MSENLSVTHAADRDAMAAAIIALCQRHGVACEATPAPLAPRALRVNLTGPHGLRAFLTLNGEAWSPDWFLLHFYFHGRGSVVLSPEFDRQVVPINPHHRRKATLCVEGFDRFLYRLDLALEIIASGDAFLVPPQAKEE